MYEFYEIPLALQSKKDLKNLYESIPETEGCMKNIGTEGGCGAKCCQFQSPSAFYVEFLYAWNYLITTWPKEKIYDLIIRSVRNVISNAPTKGCACWDSDSKLCLIHERRCFNCRIYAQTPEEEFKPRYEKLKVLYSENPNAVIMDQCNLVCTVGKSPTTEEINEWFFLVMVAERDMGLSPTLMHDGDGGTYRTYHDHIILKIGSPGFLKKLTELRELTDNEAKEKFVETLAKQLKSGAIKL